MGFYPQLDHELCGLESIILTSLGLFSHLKLEPVILGNL